MIYLDNAATSFPKAPGVSEAVAYHIANFPGNIGRSSYKTSIQSSLFIYELRELLAELLTVDDSSNIIFTSNATQALNSVILGSIKDNEKILTTRLEHNSVLRPLSFLQESKHISVEYIEMNRDFSIDLDKFEQQLINSKIDKVICNACSNVTGTILPYRELSAIAKKHDIDFILDASQLVGYRELDFNQDDISAVCFPGHKGLLGPSGTGALWFNDNFSFNPLTYGGTGSKSQSTVQPEISPDKYESGTTNICGLYGLKTAVEYILKIGQKNISQKKNEVIEFFIKELNNIDEITLYSNQDIINQVGVLSINAQNMSCSNLTKYLDRKDIATRMGLHCAPLTHKFLGTFNLGGTVRFSPSYFTTEEEIKITIKELKEIIHENSR